MARFTPEEQTRLNELNAERARIKAAAKKRDIQSRLDAEAEVARAKRAYKLEFDNRIRRVLINFMNDMKREKIHLVKDALRAGDPMRYPKIEVFQIVDSELQADPVNIRWVFGRGFEWD